MANNKVLEAVVFIEGSLEHTHMGTRELITAGELRMIKGKLTSAINSLVSVEADSNIVLPLTKIVSLIDEVMKENNIKETPVFVKDTIINEITNIMPTLYVFAGKFYEKEEFDYNPRISPILNNVIDNCIKNGYYFGY